MIKIMAASLHIRKRLFFLLAITSAFIILTISCASEASTVSTGPIGTITGRAMDSQGKPVGGAMVEAKGIEDHAPPGFNLQAISPSDSKRSLDAIYQINDKGITTTATDGTFTLRHVPTGKYIIFIVNTGKRTGTPFGTTEKTLNIAAGKIVNIGVITLHSTQYFMNHPTSADRIHIHLLHGRLFATTTGGNLIGQVIDPDHHPIAEARVKITSIFRMENARKPKPTTTFWIENFQTNAWTNKNGSFALHHLPPANYSITCSYNSFASGNIKMLVAYPKHLVRVIAGKTTDAGIVNLLPVMQQINDLIRKHKESKH